MSYGGIIGYDGDLGSGKTANMTRDAYIDGWRAFGVVAANYELYFAPFRKWTLNGYRSQPAWKLLYIRSAKDILGLKHCMLLIDETCSWFFNRKWQETNEEYIRHWTQSRKASQTLRLACPSLDTVDITLRSLIRIKIHCRILQKWGKGEWGRFAQALATHSSTSGEHFRRYERMTRKTGFLWNKKRADVSVGTTKYDYEDLGTMLLSRWQGWFPNFRKHFKMYNTMQTIELQDQSSII